MGTADRTHDDLIGRGPELALLIERVHSGRICHVHGLAGIGKSTLLDTFARRAQAGGTCVIAFDCRAVEPTQRGLLHAAGGFPDVDSLLAYLNTIDDPVVVVFDHYEVFRLMDTWLRQALVPALPPGVTLVFGSRERPVAGWFGVDGFCAIALVPLAEAEARQLLASRGVGATEAVRLNRIARGHPLALVLVSVGVAENPRLGLEDAAVSRVVEELARLYFEDVDDPLTRRAIEAASVVRRATEPVLDAMLDGDGAGALQRLLGLPFVVHESVRAAVATYLRCTNPVRYREYRRAAWRQLRVEMRAAAVAELWRYTADTLYLLDNPVVREAFFPSDAQPLAVEPATTSDEPAICAIAERHEGPVSARLLRRWWAVAPSAFAVSRNGEGRVAGFFLLLQSGQIRPALVGDDPVVGTWAQHLQRNPLARGEVALGLRRWLDAERGEAPGTTQAACWLDVKRTYMALRPALRRMYVTVEDVRTYWPIVRELRFRPLSAPVSLDGREYATVVLDFGPDSVDGWLVDVLATELGLADEPAVDTGARELTVRGAPIALTPLEFGLFRHLRDREGRTITRPELLREVWGTEYNPGSNVVDAVVRTLRAKLGPGTSVIEAVRGRGYRLREDWRTRLR